MSDSFQFTTDTNSPMHFGQYDAVKPTNKRKAPSSIIKSEDATLKARDRRALSGGVADQVRNFEVAGWVVRKHLSFVADFEFQLNTKNKKFNKAVERFVRENWSPRRNFDYAKRHRRERFIRLAEAQRVLSGDIGLVMLRNGRVQAIEGDRIQDDHKVNEGEKWCNGVRVNPNSSAAIEYGVWNRGEGGQGYGFARRVSARNFYLHAHFDSAFRFDQVRGVSPLSAALNSFADAYDAKTLALAKMKVEQLFAAVIYSDALDAEDEEDEDEDDTEGAKYSLDLGRGPIKVELDPGDKMDFLKSDNPGSNTREFWNLVIAIAMKALDIPYNFYDESHTNFFGSTAAWKLYSRSTKAAKGDIREMLMELTYWRFKLAILRGEITPPADMTLRDIMRSVEWIAVGMPWWDTAKEIRGDLAAIQAGLSTPQKVCKERGMGTFEDNIAAIAEAKKIAEKAGVAVSFAPEPETPESEGDDEDND